MESAYMSDGVYACPPQHLKGSTCNWHSCPNLGVRVLTSYSVPPTARNVQPQSSSMRMTPPQVLEQNEKEHNNQQAQSLRELQVDDSYHQQIQAHWPEFNNHIPQTSITGRSHVRGNGIAFPMSYPSQTPVQFGNSSSTPFNAALHDDLKCKAYSTTTEGGLAEVFGVEQPAMNDQGPLSAPPSTIEHTPSRVSKKFFAQSAMNKWATDEDPPSHIRSLPGMPFPGKARPSWPPGNSSPSTWAPTPRKAYPPSSSENVSHFRDAGQTVPSYNIYGSPVEGGTIKTISGWNRSDAKFESNQGSKFKSDDDWPNDGWPNDGWTNEVPSERGWGDRVLSPVASPVHSYMTDYHGKSNLRKPSASSNISTKANKAPKWPTLQATATASEPSEELVSTVESYTGCARSVAVRALKVKSNSVEAATNAILVNEDLDKSETSTNNDSDIFYDPTPHKTCGNLVGWDFPESDNKPGISGSDDRSEAASSVWHPLGWAKPAESKANSIYSSQQSKEAWSDRNSQESTLVRSLRSELADLHCQMASLQESVYHMQEKLGSTKPSNEVDFLRGLVNSDIAHREAMHRVEVQLATMTIPR